MKKLILLISILGLSINGYCRTYQDIIDQIRVDLNDTGPTSDEYYYSDEDMVRAINFIQDEISRIVQVPEGVYTATTTAGVQEYDLPSDIVGKPLRVAYYNTGDTNTFKRLDMKTINGLDTENENWESRSDGLPKEYYLRADKVGFVPAPSASYSTDTWKCFEIQYVKKITDVSTATLTSTVFSGHPQYQNFSNVIIRGVEAVLAGAGMNTYYTLLQNMKSLRDEKYDLFIDREPNRRMR